MSAKTRLGNVKRRSGELRMLYAKGGEAGSGDMCYVWGAGVSKRDAALLNYVIGSKRYSCLTKEWEPSLLDDLKERGYDITTFTLSVRKLPEAKP